MRYLCVFFLTAAIALPVDFNTGQAARMVIGQKLFTAGDPGASRSVMGGVSGLAYVNNTLYVVDANRVGSQPVNNRVLVYQNLSNLVLDPTQEAPQGTACPLCGGDASLVLGQPDFTTTTFALTQTGLRTPSAVATDGTILAVADTDNNRVLIWKHPPAVNDAPADVVVGQPDFTTGITSVPPTAKSMRGPQGVWIQNGKLYVADTQNHRVLIYNSVPTSNGAAADLVLGQPDLTTFVQPDLTQATSDAAANNLLNPVAVTSDGTHLFVTDLGHHRVLIWNSIPTKNQQPADVELGQPSMTSGFPNNAFTGTAATTSGDKNVETPVLCTVSNGTDSNSKPTYPTRCAQTLSFPRYALSDGTWLFVADGGNDRVLVYRHVPTTNAAAPDIILGQSDATSNGTSAAADRMQTPMSLAFDGQNLFVSDAYGRRVLVFTMADPVIPPTGVRNAASLEIFALGAVTIGGTIAADDTVTVTINGTDYKYKIVKTDTLATVVTSLVGVINAGKGDPNVIAIGNPTTDVVELTSRKPGADGNAITLAATVSDSAKITAGANSATLSGGQDAAQIGPGTVITIYGKNLSESTVSEPGTGKSLPNELGGARVYVNGVRAPLFFVSPSQINAQMPLFVNGLDSASVYVWTRHADGTLTATTPSGVTIVPENPGIFTKGGNDPRPAVIFHASNYATGTVSVDGSINAGDVGTLVIGGRTYTYTVLSTDTLETVRDGLVAVVNKDTSAKVKASAAGVFTRIRLQAKAAGKAGVGITYTASVSASAKLLLTATTAALCCPNTGPATALNPVVPGETITIYATGLGYVQPPYTGFETGRRYDGPVNQPVEFLSSLAGGKTANVILASPAPGMVGVWQVQLETNSGLTTDPLTQLTIAQNIYVSNIVTFPVKVP